MSDSPEQADVQAGPAAPREPTAILPAGVGAGPAPIEVTDLVAADGQVVSAGLARHGMTLPSMEQLQVMQVMAKTVAASGKYPSLRDEAQALTVMLIGHSLNISPLAALSGVHIFDGKVALGANLMLGVVQRTGRYRFIWREANSERAVITLWQDGYKEEAVTVEWTLEMAKAAGLYPRKDNWKNFPRAMLEARCVSEAIRMRAAEVLLGGAYTPDELGATVDYLPDGREVVMALPGDDGPLPKDVLPGDDENWSMPLEWAEVLQERMIALGWDEYRQALYMEMASASKQKALEAALETKRLVKEAQAANGEAPTTEPQPETPAPAGPVVTPPTVEEALGPQDNGPVPEGVSDALFSQLVDAMAWLETPDEHQAEVMANLQEQPVEQRQQFCEAIVAGLQQVIAKKEAAAAPAPEAQPGKVEPLIPAEERAVSDNLFGNEAPAHDQEPPASSRKGSVRRPSARGQR